MKAMILAAGRGKRMMPLTKNTPKPLLKTKGKPLIEHSISALKKAGITDIVINTAYLGEQIKTHLGDGKKFGVQLQYSTEQHALETAGGIIQALPLLGGQPFIVINSDILCDYDLSSLALPLNSLAHLVLINNPEHHPDGDFSIDTEQKITFNKNNRLTFSGIGIYHPSFFKNYRRTQCALALYPLLKEAINNQQLTGEYHSGYWHDIGTPKRLELINQQI
ncbi:N-acetylmuramate alpha-1-phosphate uridylyltransferase MurU [Bathymodiolus thermophilus thioautotrophic gill symbiont]|uniref:Mannose-1-phosphate guanylyltransferase n=1 Tax=Bathymodiolus thermophilus thioautotrophic gill symbiont TaxID=2360 RepID=A0A1J5TW03_9GAMM|nr:nucleotidyltransferase family protein [Bathymodiolus thermophilus thioautotrophic gill symbiont]OIR24938.1 mannose-1-phosphate guanylyltransferase [Bathymodiolus thermophilus thioautotrophic gill symbiont]